MMLRVRPEHELVELLERSGYAEHDPREPWFVRACWWIGTVLFGGGR